MGDLFRAIGSPDTLAFDAYSATIIDSSKRDEILDYEQSSKKKRALLTAVEAQIQLRPSVYYDFVKILSKNASMDFICQNVMREQCGKSQLHKCSYSFVSGVCRIEMYEGFWKCMKFVGGASCHGWICMLSVYRPHWQ